MSAPQTVESIKVTDFMGVNGEVTVYPENKNLVVIAGANGSGKSSFINAVKEVFAPGGKKDIPRPIHNGREQASVEILTNEARIVRTWTEDGTPGKLEAWALDTGKKYASGKEFIAQSIGGAVFDTEEFIGLPEAKQREQLLARVTLPFNLAVLDAERKAAYDNRRDVKRDAEAFQSQLAGYPAIDPSLPATETSASAIMAELEAIRAHNRSVDNAQNDAQHAENRATAALTNANRLHAEFEAAKLAYQNATQAQAETAAIATAAVRKSEDALAASIATVDETNGKIRQQAQRAIVQEKATAKRLEAEAFDTKIQQIDKTKTDGLAAANFPVLGLSVDDEGITFNGVPFKQVNSAMQRVVAFDLATSATPDLRFVFIGDGDLLDSDTLAGINRVATERGYLVITERDRDESRAVGAVFVDGKLA